jgi:alpha-mannosidase
VRGQPRITFDVDVEPDPLDLDVDALRAEVEAAVSADPDATWHVRIVARRRRRLLARIPVPALGWATLRPVEGAAAPPDPVRIDEDERGLRNAALAVRVAADGSLHLEAADGTRLDGVGRMVEGGDGGDSYNYGPPARDTLIDMPHDVTVRVVERGPLRASLATERTYDWPVGLAEDGTARSVATLPTTVTTRVELRADEPFVRIALDFENRSIDHRVRFHIPTPLSASESRAEGQFAVVERGTAPEGGYHETPLATYPARGFVDAGGVAVLLDHVTEYELLDAAPGSELAITVLRAIGLISRNANPYREDPAGPEIAIPGAQCRGPWHMAFALFPHAGSWTDADVVAMAERYQHRFASAAGTQHDSDGALAAEPGLELEGRDVVLSALHRRDDGWIELRLVNESGAPVQASLRGRLREAREASIIGRPGGRIGLEGETLRLALSPWEIRTIQVRHDEPQLTSADVLDSVGPRLAR